VVDAISAGGVLSSVAVKAVSCPSGGPGAAFSTSDAVGLRRAAVGLPQGVSGVPLGAAAGVEDALGKEWELTNPPLATIEGCRRHENAGGVEARSYRYRLQSAVRELIPSELPARCYWAMAGPWVSGKYSDAQQRAFFSKLLVCGSVWGCPICAARVSEGRLVEVEAALEYAILSDLLESFQQARGACLRGKSRRKVWDGFEVTGTVTALEVTFGQAGWHVHSHEVWFLPAATSADELGELETMLLDVWKRQVVRAGLRDVTERGLQVRRSAPSAAYLVKINKAAATELTKAVTKRGRQGNRTPLQLLEDHLAGDRRSGRLWVEYFEAFKDRRQLTWSRGLRKLLLPDLEYTPDETMAALEPVAREVVRLLPEHWSAIQKADARLAVLRAIERGEQEGGEGAVAAVSALLEGLGLVGVRSALEEALELPELDWRGER
jgi:hypothetical protein